ncbi:MAG TPA: ABC transporter permease [Gemmatimonadales bacterium]|nr:ABC transporter permease [Gemmatimonadales bacterium]
MSLWRQLSRGLRVLVNRRVADREIADEVEHYLEQATAEQLTRGLSPEAARRAARLEVGGVPQVREAARSYGWENAVSSTLSDFRYAWRRLRLSPGFTFVAVLTLGLGIGAGTAIWSAVNPVLLRPLPYPAARRLVAVADRLDDGAPLGVTYGNFREVLARSRSFSELAVWRPWQPTLVGPDQPERFNGQVVSAGYFRTLRVVPALGRDFEPADDQPGGRRVVLLSHGLWRRAFGGDSAIVGRSITLDGEGYTVVGVMPGDFESLPGSFAELWTPLRYPLTLPSEGPEWGHNLAMLGRLADRVPLETARAELVAIAVNPVAEFARPAWSMMRRGLTVTPLQAELTRGVQPALLALLGAVLLVLGIASVNVANLLLARGVQRRGELAMRAALGAGRGRLMRELLSESLLLAGLGGVLGVGIAVLGVRALVRLAPADLPRLASIEVDGAALLVALGLSTLTGLLVGLLPALQLSRQDLKTGLQEGGARLTGGHQRTRQLLVVGEVALAVVLLVSAGLLYQSVARLFAVDPGFAADHVLTMRLATSGDAPGDSGATARFFAQALGAVRAVPGVRSAGLTSQLPLSGDGDLYGAHFESSPDGRNEGRVTRYGVSPGYLETMGIRLVRGRTLDQRDRADAPFAALLSQSFARRKFPDRDPIGQRLHVGPERGQWYTVVGVVADVKQLSLAGAAEDAVYLPTEQSWFTDVELSLVVRVDGDPLPLAPAVKAAIWSVDRSRPIGRVAAMRDVVAASAAVRRFAMLVLQVFALVSLLLAATGIYGMFSGRVTERLREIGVRAALGASPRTIVAMVVRQGLLLIGLGAAAGMVGAVLASQLLVTLLYSVSRVDPLTYAAVIGVLALVSAVACGLPASRAARVDPTVTLRAS